MTKTVVIITLIGILILFSACVPIDTNDNLTNETNETNETDEINGMDGIDETNQTDENSISNITDGESQLGNITDNIAEGIGINNSLTNNITDVINDNYSDSILDNLTNITDEMIGNITEPDDNQTGITSISLAVFAEGFTSPVKIIPMGNDSYLVADQIGLVWHLNSTGGKYDEPFLDLTEKMVAINENYDEKGLLGIAIHPDNSSRFYAYYSAPLRDDADSELSHTSIVAQYDIISDGNASFADIDSELIILEIDQPQSNHNGGDIVFGPDGYLYIPLGDGGGANDVGEGHGDLGNGQDTSTLLGSILRIDVNIEDNQTEDINYNIPQDNPFIDDDDDDEIRDEIFAYGFRNPYRISFDEDGNLYAADVGQNRYEEVNIVVAGGNYGWNIKEGSDCFDSQNPSELNISCSNETQNLIDPVIVYPNENIEDGIGSAIIGGYIYSSENISGLQGKYVFADWNGIIMISNPQDISDFESLDIGEGLETDAWDYEIIYETDDIYILGFGEDSDGELFVLTSQNSGPTGETGQIHKIVSGSNAGNSTN